MKQPSGTQTPPQAPSGTTSRATPTRPLLFLAAAADDAARAAAGCEHQAPGLGRALLADLDQQARRIQGFPGSYPLLHALPTVRRANLERFACTLIYRELPQAIPVLGLYCANPVRTGNSA